MKGGSIKYLIKEGVRNLWTNRLMTFASVGVLTACLLIVGFAMLFSADVNSIVGYIEEQNEIVVFLEKENTEERNLEIQAELEALPDIGEVVYVSREEVFEREKEKLGSAAALLEENGDNPYYAIFEVRENDLSKLEETTAHIEQIDGVQQVNSSPGFADAVLRMKQMVNVFGGAIIIALILVSLVVITNTIRAAVFARRKEINIMKYVGATNGFIRIPFMVEGVLLGVISALLSFLLVWGGYSVVFHAITGDTAMSFVALAMQNILPFRAVAWQIGGCFLGAGIITGVLGSVISIRSHLKV